MVSKNLPLVLQLWFKIFQHEDYYIRTHKHGILKMQQTILAQYYENDRVERRARYCLKVNILPLVKVQPKCTSPKIKPKNSQAVPNPMFTIYHWEV